MSPASSSVQRPQLARSRSSHEPRVESDKSDEPSRRVMSQATTHMPEPKPKLISTRGRGSLDDDEPQETHQSTPAKPQAPKNEETPDKSPAWQHRSLWRVSGVGENNSVERGGQGVAPMPRVGGGRRLGQLRALRALSTFMTPDVTLLSLASCSLLLLCLRFRFRRRCRHSSSSFASSSEPSIAAWRCGFRSGPLIQRRPSEETEIVGRCF